jgi:Lrp/AsnC family leucine-responsive transcriptional regulator
MQAYIMINLFSGNLKSFLAIVKGIEEVQQCCRITGSQNVQLKVLLRDQTHLLELLDKLLVYGDTTTHLILSEVKNQI